MVGWEACTSRCINDQQNRSHEGEEKDGRGEDGTRGPTLDQGRDEDSTNTLSSLVNPLRSTH